MKLKVNKALIEKYLEGSCNEEELKQVRRFLNEDNAQQLFDEVWDQQWADQIKADTSAQHAGQMTSWKNTIHSKIEAAGLPAEDIRIPFLKKPGIWKYAAIWTAVILGISFFAMELTQKPEAPVVAYIQKYNPNGKRTIITLPDSSQVYLGPGSRLGYTEHFSSNTREVNLEGEAFFEVTKNPKKPFIIHTGNVTTQVLGTSFKVSAFLNKPVTVLVSTGKVRVDRHLGGKTESIAVLTPGQTVTWNEVTQLKTAGTAEVADISGWKDGHLVFNQTRLAEITSILERWYDVKISFRNKKTANRLMKVNLTANVPINTLMKILAASGQFKFNMQSNQITIL